MKRLLFLFILISTLSIFAYSQKLTDFNLLITGKIYSIVLFDDTEYSGKVVSVDSLHINIFLEDRIVPVLKSDILYFRDEKPGQTNKYSEKYMSFSFAGGPCILAIGNFYTNNDRQAMTGINIDPALTIVMSKNKAIKIDFNFTYVKNPDNTVSYGSNSSLISSTNTGGDIMLSAARFSFVLGDFNRRVGFNYGAAIGLGFHYLHTTEHQYSYINNDSTRSEHSYISEPNNIYSAVFSLNLFAGFLITDKFGIRLDGEMNSVVHGGFFFFNDENYFPFRAGIFYNF